MQLQEFVLVAMLSVATIRHAYVPSSPLLMFSCFPQQDTVSCPYLVLLSRTFLDFEFQPFNQLYSHLTFSILARKFSVSVTVTDTPMKFDRVAHGALATQRVLTPRSIHL